MIREIVDTWLNNIERDLVVNYDRLGLRASGEWERSLEQFAKFENGFIKVGIRGADYTKQLEAGRRPNKDQSDEGLKAWVGWAGSTFLDEWVKNKGLNLNPYAVAWKIAREGWDVPNPNNTGGLVSDVVNRNRMLDLIRDVSKSIIAEFKSDVISKLK
jgi:hypothetical protein